jgi:phage terminase large subunit-like protein
MRKKDLSFQEIGGLLKEGLVKAISRPTIHGYIPHEKQVQFHEGSERGKLYIGGNRSGKTVGGIVEDIWWLRGEHPYRELFKPPVRGRIVTVSYTEGIKLIIIPELAKWLPPSDLINGSWEDSYAKADRVLTLANGSTVELMSYDQKLEKFAGTSRHFIHFDEEPPQDIYNECRLRLLDTAGSWWMTMTPVEGMTWVYDNVFMPNQVPGGNILVVIIDTEENPYVSKAEIESALEGLDANERKARKEGKFVQLGGTVFNQFIPKFAPVGHLLEPLTEEQLDKIKDWTHYASLDHGLNNPTAWLWHAVSPKGAVVTYDEVYDNERLVNDFAQEIHERNKLPGRHAPQVYVGDPAIAQRNAQTGDSIQTAYAMAGVPIVLGNNDVKIGVDKMNRYLKNGKWAIAGCPNLVREIQRVRWKIYETSKKRRDNNLREEIHKKDDHAPDSARYFFSLMPDLYLPPDGPKPGNPNALIKASLNAVTTPVGPYYFDRNLQRQLNTPSNTEWSALDEHMGGIW